MKNINLYKIFVSSPSDIQEERTILENSVQKLNRQLPNIRIELIQASTHTYPSSGNDAQNIINDQIGNDYDIYMGLFWKNFGTPTPRYNSGTEEEYYVAVQHFQKQKNKKIMFYFNDSPINPSEIDPTQLGLIKEFKTKIQESQNILYHSYLSVDEFEQKIDLHLLNTVNKIHEINNSNNENKNLTKEVFDLEDEDDLINIDDVLDELDLFDHLEIIEQNIGEIKRVGLRLGTVMSDLSSSINNRLDQLSNLKIGGKVINVRKAKSIFDFAASDMQVFDKRTSIECPIFREASDSLISSLKNAIMMTINGELDDTDKSELGEIRQIINELRCAFLENKNESIIMKQIIVLLPKYSSKLNKAKRNAAKSLKELIKEFTLSAKLLKEIEDNLDSIIK